MPSAETPAVWQVEIVVIYDETPLDRQVDSATRAWEGRYTEGRTRGYVDVDDREGLLVRSEVEGGEGLGAQVDALIDTLWTSLRRFGIEVVGDRPAEVRLIRRQ